MSKWNIDLSKLRAKVIFIHFIQEKLDEGVFWLSKLNKRPSTGDLLNTWIYSEDSFVLFTELDAADVVYGKNLEEFDELSLLV